MEIFLVTEISPPSLSLVQRAQRGGELRATRMISAWLVLSVPDRTSQLEKAVIKTDIGRNMVSLHDGIFRCVFGYIPMYEQKKRDESSKRHQGRQPGSQATVLTDGREREAVWCYLLLLHQNQQSQRVPAPFLARSNRRDRRTAAGISKELEMT